MEAVIGAIYLDGGFANAKEFIHRFILKDIEHKKLFYDSKTILQEIVQGDFKEDGISYVLAGEEGPDHDKKFFVDVLIGEKVIARGTGHTKKGAEQEAAYRAIITLKMCIRDRFRGSGEYKSKSCCDSMGRTSCTGSTSGVCSGTNFKRSV